MSVVKPEIIGKPDARLAYLLEQVKEGTTLFATAVRESSDQHQSVSFKAFTLKTERKDEALAIFDIIMIAVALELKECADDLIARFTFFHSIGEGEGDYSLFLHCRKVAPPTKQDIDDLIAKNSEEVVLPHAHIEPDTIALVEG
jgi:hypothetical protein